MNATERKIIGLAKENNGVIRTQDVVKAGLRRNCLADLADKKELIRVRRGMYHLPDAFVDDQVELQKRYPGCVFSYGSALYYHNLSDRVPSNMTITVLQGTKVSHLQKEYDNLEIHYVKNQEILELGKTKGHTVFGQPIILYDAERCICDVLKNRKNIDKQLFRDAVKGYFANNAADYTKLVRYAKILGVEETARLYMEVL